MIEKVFVLEPAPDWCQERMDKGMVIHVAARPLYGTEVENSWEMPMVHGRHYAALDPNDDRFSLWVKQNHGLDGREVVYVSKATLLQAAFSYYQATDALRSMLDRNGIKTAEAMLGSEYEEHFLQVGLDRLYEQRFLEAG